jgi:hypothetical protein
VLECLESRFWAFQVRVRIFRVYNLWIKLLRFRLKPLGFNIQV